MKTDRLGEHTGTAAPCFLTQRIEDVNNKLPKNQLIGGCENRAIFFTILALFCTLTIFSDALFWIFEFSFDKNLEMDSSFSKKIKNLKFSQPVLINWQNPWRPVLSCQFFAKTNWFLTYFSPWEQHNARCVS
jgi:hypothetical protein